MAEYESVLCVKNEVFVYRIPARTSNRGYRAAEWKLDEPDWTGRLKVVAKGRDLTVRLEDKNSGELFAQCPVESYPSAAVEQVLDSSRYFVIRIQDVSGRAAFIGLGFADRGDSFDLLVSLQDHFKQIRREETVKEDVGKGAAALDSGPKLDLGFKEGQTITINMPTKKAESGTSSTTKQHRPRGAASGIGAAGLLPPPPGAGTRVPAVTKPPPQTLSGFDNTFVQPTPPNKPVGGGTYGVGGGASGGVDLLLDLGPPAAGATHNVLTPPQPTTNLFASDWDDFAGATSGPAPVASNKPQSVPDHNWVNFD